MKKTTIQHQYEKLIITHISHIDVEPTARAIYFTDFFLHSSDYYDLLCDNLYSISTGFAEESLWITPSGQTYIGSEKRKENDICLLDCYELPVFKDDLVDQLEYTFIRIYNLTRKAHLSVNNIFS